MISRGFIALISVMVIGLSLLALTVAASARALFAGFDAVDAIYAEEARGAARSCAEVAALALTEDETYAGGDTLSVGSGSCSVDAITDDVASVSGESGHAQSYAQAKIKEGRVTSFEEIPKRSE